MDQTQSPAHRLPVPTKLGFGVGDIGGNLFFTVLSFWGLKYLTDTVALAAAGAGLALLIGKAWDALFDPLMGLISDRTRTRWGRRRPYLLFGALPLALVFAFFFTSPGSTDQGFLFWWAVLTLAVLNTAFSVVNVPYGALTPELTIDYNERMSLNGYRMSFAVVGTLLGAAVFGQVAGMYPGDSVKGYFIAGLIFGSILAGSTLIAGFSVREKFQAGTSTTSLFASWKKVLSNGPFLIVLAGYVVNIVGITFVSALLAYFFEYVLHDAASTLIALALLLVIAGFVVPVSVLVAKRIGKIRTYQLALLILASACLLIWVGGTTGGSGFVLGVMAWAGVGMGFAYAPPFALIPDTIEVEARKTGLREEGAYYGFMTFATKVGQALATGLIGLILGWAGYLANQDQPASALAAIQTLLGPVPLVLFLVAAVILQFYPLDKKTYEDLVKE